MGWFTNIFRNPDNTLSIDTTINGLQSILDSIESADYYIDCSTTAGQTLAYQKCDVITSIISRCAESMANLKIWALDKDGRQVTTRFAKQVIDKINNPNPQEDFKMFHRKLETNIKLYGKAYVRKVYSAAFNETDYYVIPNKFVTVYYKSDTDALYNREIQFYQISDGQNTYQLAPSEIYTFYDGILSNNYDTVLGGSRLQSLSEIISMYNVLWEIRTELYGDAGARGIISLGAKDANMLVSSVFRKDKEALQQEAKKYGGRRKQWKFLFANTDAKFQSITPLLKDFDFEIAVKDAKKAMCNAFSLPPELIGVESSRFKTVPEARKEFYTQQAIPAAEYIFQNWMKMLGATNADFTLVPDYSHLDFYQEAKLQEGVAFQQMANGIVPLVTNGIITVEEARLKLDI